MKEHGLNQDDISKNKVSLKEMKDLFDDEEEKYEVKMAIKDMLTPKKKSLESINYRMFGMKPEEFERKNNEIMLKREREKKASKLQSMLGGKNSS